MLKLTITVDDSFWTDLHRKQRLDVLLADALYEFQARRQGDYPEKYRDIYPSEEEIQRKRDQIAARIRMAEDCRMGVLTAMVEERQP